jgi:hypothetical protein
MDRRSVIEIVKRVLAEITHNDAVADMDMNTSLKDDLGIDSMTSLVFLMALEDNIPGFVVEADTLEVDTSAQSAAFRYVFAAALASSSAPRRSSGMSLPLYIQAAHHHVLPQRRARLTPRDRFVEYQRDLHRIAGEQLDPDSLLAGDQYTYVELADALLDRVGAQVLPETDLLVTSYWTPEFDPEFSAGRIYRGRSRASHSTLLRGGIAPMRVLSIAGAIPGRDTTSPPIGGSRAVDDAARG